MWSKLVGLGDSISRECSRINYNKMFQNHFSYHSINYEINWYCNLAEWYSKIYKASVWKITIVYKSRKRKSGDTMKYILNGIKNSKIGSGVANAVLCGLMMMMIAQ